MLALWLSWGLAVGTGLFGAFWLKHPPHSWGVISWGLGGRLFQCPGEQTKAQRGEGIASQRQSQDQNQGQSQVSWPHPISLPYPSPITPMPFLL